MSKYVNWTVRDGNLRGITVKYNSGYDKFIAFRGIPYAKPPIGKLRFKDPEPAEPWTGIRDASKFGNIAPQFDYITKQLIGNEDCLYLNVYVKNIGLPTKRAVMVWIPGGSFVHGSVNQDIYGPNYLVHKDVVLVTINYRLGVFGFLNLDDEWAPGNQGLKDLLMALRWVHNNIANFGGDPDNVTIFGQGSGGAMVHYLAVCSHANGLFHKAISQSGTAANTWAFSDKETQKEKFFLLVRRLGRRITDPKVALKFLRSINPKDIVETSLDIMTRNERRQCMSPFVPTADCDSPNPFFVEHPAIMLRRGVKVPFIIGFTSCEGSAFIGDMDEEDLDRANSDFASIIHPSIWPALERNSMTAEQLRIEYFDNEPISMKTIAKYIDFLGDMHFYRGIFETICIQAQLNHRSTFLYYFLHEPKFSLPKLLTDLKISEPSEIDLSCARDSYCIVGAYHGEELSYLFRPQMKNDKFKRGVKLLDTERNLLSKRMTQMWTNFAKTGDPTPADTSLITIKWTPLEKEEFPFLIIDNNLEIQIKQKDDLSYLE